MIWVICIKYLKLGTKNNYQAENLVQKPLLGFPNLSYTRTINELIDEYVSF